jgi:hypothetical protein
MNRGEGDQSRDCCYARRASRLQAKCKEPRQRNPEGGQKLPAIGRDLPQRGP